MSCSFGASVQTLQLAVCAVDNLWPTLVITTVTPQFPARLLGVFLNKSKQNFNFTVYWNENKDRAHTLLYCRLTKKVRFVVALYFYITNVIGSSLNHYPTILKNRHKI
jgi:hypothetical protein